MLQELRSLVKENRLVDAALFFAEGAARADLESLHIFLSDLLPALLANEAAWLIKNPGHIDLSLDLCSRALFDEYNPAQMVYNILHLRCYKGVALVLQQRTSEAHLEILRAAGVEKPVKAPTDRVEEPSSAAVLTAFFVAYFDYLRSRGYAPQVEKVRWIIEKALSQLGEDESRCGVTRALLVSQDGKGVVRQVLVSIGEGEGIEYQHLGQQELGEALRDSAEIARQAAHAYLVSNGYPEGLSKRKVVWQIARSDGRAEDIKTLYEGPSIALALTIGIISAYVGEPIPADVAFTGAINIHGARTGEIVGVAGVPEKVFVALDSGIRRAYLPAQNVGDVSLTARKAAEGKLTIQPVRGLHAVCRDLIAKPIEQGLKAILRQATKNLLSFFFARPERSPAHRYSAHALGSAALFAAMFAADGFLFHKLYDVRPPQQEVAIVILATVVIFFGTLICYALPYPLMERERASSWWLSILILGVATAVVGLLYGSMVPEKPLDTGPAYDWPPYLAVFKNLFIFFLFGFVYVTNLFSFVLAADYLKGKRQFHTIRRSLAGDEEAIGMLPTTVLYMPFKWAVVAATFVALFLLLFEMNYYSHLSEAVPETSWIIGMGILRDAIFIALAFEVLCWYWISLTKLKRDLMQPA